MARHGERKEARQRRDVEVLPVQVRVEQVLHSRLEREPFGLARVDGRLAVRDETSQFQSRSLTVDVAAHAADELIDVTRRLGDEVRDVVEAAGVGPRSVRAARVARWRERRDLPRGQQRAELRRDRDAARPSPASARTSGEAGSSTAALYGTVGDQTLNAPDTKPYERANVSEKRAVAKASTLSLSSYRPWPKIE